ncbi:Rv3235 family protein [Sinomonas sp. ASV322]|uniref:Rv3235 family protein n=1 Tax=Sinomonas sp. ASV322 TaxID=3041920 RepID=UPI0027DB1B00|nr:Rv3235 family protein [Sinomonas sp. ASV322]MDQ4503262.1 Rv3235 family protein [Sinomonas sp. ASV322]
MNVPRLVSSQTNRRRLASIDQPGDETVVRLRTHRRGTMAQKPEREPSTDGSSALAVPFAVAAPRHLHAVGSADERKWVAQLAARITGAAIEVLAGLRPVHQLAHVAHRDVLAALQLRASLSRKDAPGAAPQLALIHRGATVLSSRASVVRPGVYEASAVVSDRLRCRAVAMRLEQIRDTGWRVTALEIG